jgi:histidinol-phosphatase
MIDLERRCWRTRGYGDFWSHMLVAEGAADLAVEPIAAVWDLAPLKIVVEEAGGRFTDLSGTPRLDGGNALSSNGLLHDAALGILSGGGTPPPGSKVVP